MDAELSTNEQIAALLLRNNFDYGVRRSPRTRGARGAQQAREDLRRCSAPSLTHARCRLRPCRECRKWIQIFEEKFADPSYYAERPPKMESPMADLCR